MHRVNFAALILFLCLRAATPAWAEAPDGHDTSFDDTPEPHKVHQTQHADQGVGKEIKNFSDQVADRVDRIVKQKSFDLWGDPWTLQGIPLILPTSATGFNLGVRLALQNIRRQDPHKFQFEAQLFASEQGRYKHFLRIDYPHIFDGKFRFTARLGYDRDVNLHYYGFGNDTTFIPGRVTNEDPLYNNIRTGPRLEVSLMRQFTRQLRIGPLFGFKWTSIQAPPGSLLEAQNPLGTAGGRTHYVGAAIVYDTTDFEPYPSRGIVNELWVNWNTNYVGSEYNFLRMTYTYRKYWPLHRDLTLASRFYLEGLTGDIPFYEMGEVGGSNPTLGIGGDRYFRGYDNNRFMDKIRMALGVELRWDPLTFGFARQELTLSFVPFFDIGRVWPDFLPLQLGGWHATGGWGMRFVWNNRFIIRADAAINSETVAGYIELGNNF